MSKYLLFFFFFIGLTSTFAQNVKKETELFGQCLFSIVDEKEMNVIQNEIASNPNVIMARLDWHTQRAFIITQGIESLSDEDFKSWFGKFSSTLHCVQIGVRGIDSMDTYPFTNCKD